MSDPKRCEDCKHFMPEHALCRADPFLPEHDLSIPHGFYPAKANRASKTGCGPQALLFEPKENA